MFVFLGRKTESLLFAAKSNFDAICFKSRELPISEREMRNRFVRLYVEGEIFPQMLPFSMGLTACLPARLPVFIGRILKHSTKLELEMHTPQPVVYRGERQVNRGKCCRGFFEANRRNRRPYVRHMREGGREGG